MGDGGDYQPKDKKRLKTKQGQSERLGVGSAHKNQKEIQWLDPT
jgi:hypothetical protein